MVKAPAGRYVGYMLTKFDQHIAPLGLRSFVFIFFYQYIAPLGLEL
jgi:hypothetical protein